MKGTQFLVDENGRPKSVVVDLEVHGDLWEGIYDEMVEEGNSLSGRNVRWNEIKSEIRMNVEQERAKYR